MKLTILGTGNATVTECYNTCFALSDGNRHFLVDTGGGNRILKVLKDTGIQLEDIHDIFITHEHIDHLLGVIWLIRMIGQKKIGQGKYEGNLRIYCHEELARSIRTIAELTIQKKVTKYFDDRILFVPVHHGKTKEILGCPVTFFDIFSTKAELQIPHLILYHTEETHLKERKELYTREGREYYRGELFVPDDLEVFEL